MEKIISLFHRFSNICRNIFYLFQVLFKTGLNLFEILVTI